MVVNKDKNKNLSEEEKIVEADQAIFGAPEPTHTADVMGVVQRNQEAEPDAPVVIKPAPKQVQPEGTINIKVEQFNKIMERLGDLEKVAISNNRSKDNIFNPLMEAVTEHMVDVTFHGDDIVVGYKEKVRPNGMRTFTWLAKDPESGEARTYVTLLLRSTTEKDEDGQYKITEETVDYVAFIEQAVTVKAKIIERKDIGQVIEQGLVNQTMWNGRTLVETSTQVMTGAKEQRWIFTVEMPNGEVIKMPENVINIKN